VSVTARAPGKLFLLGEYAVLGGAPALVAAVDRHVVATVSPAASGVTVESTDGGSGRMDPTRDPLPGGDAGTVAALVRVTGASNVHVRIDSRALLVGERKLGLGRSAAGLVAVAAALDPAATRDQILGRALAANRVLQGGRGSGADVAAAVHGGVVEARRDGEGLAVTTRTLPAGLRLVAGWTGTSAPTTPLLERFADGGASPVLAELHALAAAGADAVARGDAGALCELVDRYADALARLGQERGLPIVTRELAALVAAAREVGVVAKPSGAGAGDCGIALVRSESEAAAVRAAWRAAGIVPLDVAIAADGVTREVAAG
jgi:phosphomevalonate kinase